MNLIKTGSSHLDLWSSRLPYSIQRLQQPAAAPGGFFELADEQPRGVVPERLLVDLDLFRLGDVSSQRPSS